MPSPSNEFGGSGERHEEDVCVAFRLGGGTVALRTPNQEFSDHLARFLPDYVVPPQCSPPDESYWITYDGTTWSIGIEHTPVVDSFDSIADTLNGLEQLIVTRLLALSFDKAQIHATGTVNNGEAVVALGASGAGKTSIALSWASTGRPVLGDDVVLFNDNGTAEPFKRKFIVAAERLKSNGLDPDPCLSWLSDPKETWYDPQAGGGWATSAPVGRIALIQFDANAGLRATDMAKPEALSAFLASLLPTGMQADELFDTVLAVISRCPTIELTFSDSIEAAEFLIGEW